jgi:hypothetical protein
MGRTNQLSTNTPTRGHLGNHAVAFFAQDTWKITPKLTLDYGLRYDFQSYLREQYGRWGSWGPDVPNPQLTTCLAMKFKTMALPLHTTHKYAFGPGSACLAIHA